MDQAINDEDITLATNSFITKLFQNGYWQPLMFFLVCQSIMYAGVFVAFSGTFTSGNIDYTCNVPMTNTVLKGLPNKCEVRNGNTNTTEPCAFGYKFFADKNFIKSSIKADFELVCERRYLDGAAQSCVMAGFFIGGIFGPLIADRFGRRFILFTGLFVCGVISLSMGFLTNIYLFLIGNFIVGIAREVTMSAGFVLGLEFIPNHRQSWYGMITQIIWSINVVVLGILAFFVREWRYLQIIGSFPILLSALLFFVVPESPRWLITNGKFDQLQYLIDNFANRINGTKFDSSEGIMLKDIYKKYNDPSFPQSNTAKYGPLDIFRSRILLFWTFIMILGWIFIVLSYYGATMLSVNLSRNKYISFIFPAAMEIPSYFITFTILPKGRNLTFLCLGFLTGISFIVVGFLDPKYSIFILTLSIIGKGSLASMFYVIVVTSLYIYPTTIRTFGSSLPSAIGKLFAVIVPYFVQLRNIYVWLPTLIIGITSCLIGLINILYPDWVNEPLPETMKDIDLLKSETGLRVKRTNTDSKSLWKDCVSMKL